MELDLSSLERAIKQLNLNLANAESNLAHEQPLLGKSLRDGAIQSFEYTYSLAYKFIRRTLEIISNPVDVAECSYGDLMRMALEYGLIQNINAWFEYREKRNITSHAYNEKKAIEVYDTAATFAADAAYAFDRIKKALQGAA